ASSRNSFVYVVRVRATGLLCCARLLIEHLLRNVTPHSLSTKAGVGQTYGTGNWDFYHIDSASYIQLPAIAEHNGGSYTIPLLKPTTLGVSLYTHTHAVRYERTHDANDSERIHDG
ncbi:MAG TPA: hypothetical protein VHI13_18745, partial [Candidatus Kapabacteria bacterium]|nr:hypothetical protein [Candidatus Kapabacteria bacterium]